MSTIKADTVQPKDFASDLTLGASGDTVTVAADSINVNKVQDKGGNTLWDYSTGVFVSPKKEFASQNLKLLQTATVTGTNSISFTTGIDSTYDVYIFKFININPSTDNQNLEFQVNASGQTGYNETITSTFFYARHSEADTDASLTYYTGGDQAQGTAYQKLGWISNDADHDLVGELRLFNPSSTTYVKHFYARTTWNNDTDGLMDGYCAGYINTTSAIDDIQFKIASGNFDGTIKMYGLL
jgi:hypothetical protein